MSRPSPTIRARADNGLLKRVRSTPLRPSMYLSGLAGNVIVISIILTTLVSALGIAAYGVTFPGRYLGRVVALAAGACCFSALVIAARRFRWEPLHR